MRNSATACDVTALADPSTVLYWNMGLGDDAVFQL
jgi:hypothetical protein